MRQNKGWRRNEVSSPGSQK